MPHQWRLASHRPPPSEGADMFDCRYEVTTSLQVAAGQSGKDTWHGGWQLMIRFSIRLGVVANHCTRWLANERLLRVCGDS
ncbi:hypothetical protein Tco_0207371, partial [Tanacetum coccineum]